MADHNLLVLSDVHLGSDLVHCAQPDAPLRDGTDDQRDVQLAALFDWYREHPHGGRKWRLVIAGDFVDFVGMSVPAPSAKLWTPLDADDIALGLGGAEDHTIYKLRCVARRHRAVFEALARFIAAGNTLVVVRGNHDVDFHWPSVQDEFVRQLSLHARLERGTVEFSPWFYYEKDRVFVEHGHQYDPYCSYDHVLEPLSPSDPRRSSRSLSDILLRHVVRPTRGLLQTGHESHGLSDYVAFGLRLGLRGAGDLLARFLGAVARAFAMWREHASEGARRLRQRHEQRMADLAALLDLKLESVRALASLQRPPVTHSFGHLSLAVMLDRILLSLLAVAAVALAVLAFPWAHGLMIAVFVCVGLGATAALLSRMRQHIDPSNELRERATRVARLFPAAFVVMGHTHLPEMQASGTEEATYVNLGAWAEDDMGGVSSATRTHFVVHMEDDGRATAELRVWDAETGPRRFISAS
ncbi:MAG TPA: metallophosphoesterase [Polyangiaceae bacterium]|nr:metallophosphoesterase [Polyangiaceae bacterium]